VVGEQEPPGSYDCLVETTGSITFARSLLRHVRLEGRVYTYAIYAGVSRPDIGSALGVEDRHVRVDPTEAAAHDDVCEMLRSGRLRTESFVTHRFPFPEMTEAWRTVTERRTLKTVVTMS
jgi:threonine dehydrogenase-like Zn-dependent dehydrogenase